MPDKDFALVLVDDGERQAIMTSDIETMGLLLKDSAARDSEIVKLRSSLEDSEVHEGHKLRRWHNAETGECVPIPLGDDMDFSPTAFASRE